MPPGRYSVCCLTSLVWGLGCLRSGFTCAALVFYQATLPRGREESRYSISTETVIVNYTRSVQSSTLYELLTPRENLLHFQCSSSMSWKLGRVPLLHILVQRALGVILDTPLDLI